MNRIWISIILIALALPALACHPELEGSSEVGGDDPFGAESFDPAAPVGTIAPYDTSDVAPAPTPEEGQCGSAMGRAQTELTNRERAEADLPPLACHDGLTVVAIDHSQDMAERLLRPREP